MEEVYGMHARRKAELLLDLAHVASKMSADGHRPLVKV